MHGKKNNSTTLIITGHRRKVFGWAVISVLSIIGLLWWILRFNQTVSPRSPGDDIEPPISTNLFPNGFVWQPDDRQMYDLKVKSSIALGDSPLHIEVKGTLNSRVVALQDSVFVAFQMAPVQVLFNGAPSLYLAGVYSNLMISVFDRSGMALEAMTPALLAPQDRKALANIIYSLQCVVPSLNDRMAPHHWIVEEKDVNGSFAASYTISNGVVFKTKESYSSYAQGGTTAMSMEVLSSSIRANVSETNSWLDALSGQEALEAFLDTNLVSKSDTSWSIERIPFSPDPNLAIWQDHGTLEEWLNTVALFGKGDPFSPVHLAALEKQRLDDSRAKYKDVPVADIVASLADSVQANQGHTHTIPFIHAMRDYLTAYPERALDIPEKIKTDKLDDQVAGRIMLALELAGHPEAQQALATIYSDDQQAPHQRLQALAAIGGVGSPTEESVNRLGDFVDTEADRLIRDNAWLALGAISEHADDVARNELREKMIDLLARKEDQDVALLALDNAGGAPIPAVTNAVASGNPIIRTYAIKNLRHYTNQVSKSVLEKVLTNDPEPSVRRKAIDILEQYANSDADRLVRAHLPNESDEELKKKMIRYLGTRNSEPGNREALESLLTGETNAVLQEAIRKALFSPTTED